MTDGTTGSEAGLRLDARQAEALSAAVAYLTGFGRLFRLLDDTRYAGSDLRDVVSTLRELHRLAIGPDRRTSLHARRG